MHLLSQSIRARRLLLLFAVLAAPSAMGLADKTILVLGDSIGAGYGLKTDLGWVNLLAERLSNEGYPHRVVNASVSGEISAGGLRRLPKLLDRHRPDLLILELGGNDGLRGFPVERLRDNLSAAIALATTRKCRTLMVGMILPPNYGRRYIQTFTDVFVQVSNQHRTPLVTFPADDFFAVPGMLQSDGIHPSAEAQPLLLNYIWTALEPLLAGDNG